MSFFWSSSSRIVNPGLTPRGEPQRRRNLLQIEWKVPLQMPVTPETTRCARSSISRAARFVNVSSRMCSGGTPFSTKYATRCTSVRVLPVPAAASTSIGPSGAVAAAHCSGLRTLEKSMAMSDIACFRRILYHTLSPPRKTSPAILKFFRPLPAPREDPNWERRHLGGDGRGRACRGLTGPPLHSVGRAVPASRRRHPFNRLLVGRSNRPCREPQNP